MTALGSRDQEDTGSNLIDRNDLDGGWRIPSSQRPGNKHGLITAFGHLVMYKLPTKL